MAALVASGEDAAHTVVLSGGVFQNALLLRLVLRAPLTGASRRSRIDWFHPTMAA